MMDAKQVAAAIGAAYSGDCREFSGITTDSRSVRPGELFVALAGGNFDGHDYCAAAVDKGAAGVVVTRAVEGLGQDTAVFKVQDTLRAYQQLAAAYRRFFPRLKVFAVTGSNGKTSTKDLLAVCLGAKYRVLKTRGNFNNEIGLPKRCWR